MFKYQWAATVRWRSAFAVVLCSGLAIAPSAAEAALRGKARADFLRADFKRCAGNAHKHPIARNLAPDILHRQCSCAGNYAADRLTGADAAIVAYGNFAERQQMFRKAHAFSHEGWRTCVRASQTPGF